MAKVRLYVSSFFDVDIPSVVNISRTEALDYFRHNWSEHIDEEAING